MAEAIWISGGRDRWGRGRSDRDGGRSVAPHRRPTEPAGGASPAAPTDSEIARRLAAAARLDDEREILPGRNVYPFNAAIDLTELDARYRPSLTWSGRTAELSRAHLTFRSRRMCHAARRVLVAIHLIDATPVPLFGEVIECEYDGEGMYRTVLSLLPIPEIEVVQDWIGARDARGSL